MERKSFSGSFVNTFISVTHLYQKTVNLLPRRLWYDLSGVWFRCLLAKQVTLCHTDYAVGVRILLVYRGNII